MIRPGIPEYFRLRPRPERVATEVDEEIAFHIEQRVRKLIDLGYTEESARAEAERRFGALARARLTLQRSANRREYHMTIREWLTDWRKDFAYTARSLIREPLVSVVVIVTLALGIGANAMMFGIIDRLLLRGPDHVVNPRDLYRMYISQENFDGHRISSGTGYPVYTALKTKTRSFDGVAFYAAQAFSRGKGEDTKDVPGARTTWDLFPLLGVHPVLGHFFSAAEDHTPKGDNVAVIGYNMWKSEYGGQSDVLGKTITLSDETYTIIGVAPRGFTGPELKPVSVWIPYSAGKQSKEWATSWCCTGPQVIARIRKGVSPEAAGADATHAYRVAAIEATAGKWAAVHQVKNTVTALPTSYDGEGKPTAESSVTSWLGGVSLIVLIVACANVVNLLLARAVRRRREVSIRLAMGISRARLSRLLLTESTVLALAGGSAAIAIAYWGGEFIRKTLLPDIEWGSPVSLRVLLFSASISIMVGLIVGLAPALQAARQDLTATLKATSQQGGGNRRSNLRDALTVLQAALSLVLLVGAGLFVRSLRNIDNLDLGIDANHVISASAWLPDVPGETDFLQGEVRQDVFNRAVMTRMKTRPDVASVSLALGAPLGNSFGVDLKVPGLDSLPKFADGGPYIMAVTSTYFETVGTRLVRGRVFAPSEGKGTAPIVIVNEMMARTLWPNQDALTKCLIIGGDTNPCASVIGIVKDVHRKGLREGHTFQYYVPMGQESGVSGSDLLVRPRGDADAFIPTLRHEMAQIAPNAHKFYVQRLGERLDPEIRPWRLGATLFIAFGALAMLISAIGLFSVIAYSVSQRRTELGIRLVLGARANSIVGLVLRQGVKLAGAGIAFGILLVLLTSRFIEPLLFDTNARDVMTILAVSAVLLLTAVVACILPAVRAGRVDPVSALRAD